MSAPPPVTPDFTVRGAHVMDESGDFGGPSDVRVVHGRIDAIGPDLPRDSLDVDLAGRWLMPGVIDTHLHAVTHSFDGWEQINTPYSYRIAETLSALRHTLAAGVTFVRDAGGLDAGIRNAVAAGLADAPELQVSVVPLSRTGGHGDGFLSAIGRPYAVDGMLPDYPGRPPHTADGVDEVRRAVRTILRSGADWIKIMATGGVMSAGDGDFPAEFTDDELTTAIVEAARRGKPSMVHALGGPAIAQAVQAGARSIEHGLWLTEADAALMAGTGATLVPTLGIYAQLAELAATPGALPPATAQRASAAGEVLGEAVRIARAAGVPIALGTDFAHRDHHGHNLSEISHLASAGLTVSEALVAATSAGADLCGIGDVTGRLRVGHRFDAIVLDADPSDPQIFARADSVGGVFAAGRPVRPHPRWPQRC